MEKAAVGDYSFLISSIEGHLAQYEGAESSFIAPESSLIEPPTTTKRTYENISTPSVNHNKPAPPISTAKKIRLEAESDELRLINEQLHDKLNRITDDSERMKEKLQRQLTFLDNENNELRHAITKANDKYFEDKKNTTIQLRNYENEINALKKQITTLESTTPTATTSSQDKPKQIKETNYQNLDIFEAKLVEKVQEVKKLSILNAELEEKISYLEQDVLVLKTKYHSSSSSSGGGVSSSSSSLVYTSDIGVASSSAAVVGGAGAGTGAGPSETYIKSLEKKSEEYDMQLRRKNKEIEKLISKLENQSILEDENMSLKAKVQYLNTQLTESLSIETKYKALMQEKASWNQLFKQVVQDSKHITTSTESSVSTQEEVSPMAVLRILSATQQRCTLALDREGKLELQVKEQKRAIVTLEQQLASVKDDLAQYEDKEQEHVRKTKLLSQQLQLYTGEIDNLRSLMRSYDAEFKIGHKPDATMTMLLLGKDETIASLRKEADECRAAVKQHVEALLSLQDEVKRLSAQQLQQQQQQSEKVKPGDNKYAAYAKEDLDFDPATTKVRHINNMRSTMPLTAIPLLRRCSISSRTHTRSRGATAISPPRPPSPIY